MSGCYPKERKNNSVDPDNINELNAVINGNMMNDVMKDIAEFAFKYIKN